MLPGGRYMYIDMELPICEGMCELSNVGLYDVYSQYWGIPFRDRDRAQIYGNAFSASGYYTHQNLHVRTCISRDNRHMHGHGYMYIHVSR